MLSLCYHVHFVDRNQSDIDFLFLHDVTCLTSNRCTYSLSQILNSNIFNLILQAGQPELIALEKALKKAMVPAGKAREVISRFIFVLSVARLVLLKMCL